MAKAKPAPDDAPLDDERPAPEVEPAALVRFPEQVLVDINACEPVPWNPNVENVGTFNALVAAIREHGFVEPVVLVILPDSEGKYAILGGENRWKAAKLLGYTKIPAVIVDEPDPDTQKALNIQLNAVHGRFDPGKFAALWNELEKKHGYAAALKMIGMSHLEKQVQQMVKDAAGAMPTAEMKAELLKRRDDIRTVEDLAAIVNAIYAKYGGELADGFMFFSFGGQVHLMLKMSKPATAKLRSVVEDYRLAGKKADAFVEDWADQMAHALKDAE